MRNNCAMAACSSRCLSSTSRYLCSQPFPNVLAYWTLLWLSDAHVSTILAAYAARRVQCLQRTGSNTKGLVCSCFSHALLVTYLCHHRLTSRHKCLCCCSHDHGKISGIGVPAAGGARLVVSSTDIYGRSGCREPSAAHFRLLWVWLLHNLPY